MVRPALVLASAAAGWVAALGPAAAPTLAPAAAVASPAVEHRAAVIVDTGTEVKSMCVRFREESLTGIEALTRASVDPVFRAFPGKGAAVCSLCGTGCPGDGSCLTCDAGGRFWSYSRAPAGSGALRTSGAGASSTAVRDGDVEGWQWGRGGTPPFATVEQVCGEVAPATSSTTTATTGPPVTSAPPSSVPATSAATGGSVASTTPPRAAAPPSTAPDTGTGAAVTATAPVLPSSTAPLVTTGDGTATTTSPPPGGTGALASSSDDRRDGGGGGWAGLAGFGAVLAGLVAWAVVARQRRQAGD